MSISVSLAKNAKYYMKNFSYKKALYTREYEVEPALYNYRNKKKLIHTCDQDCAIMNGVFRSHVFDMII